VDELVLGRGRGVNDGAGIVIPERSGGGRWAGLITLANSGIGWHRGRPYFAVSGRASTFNDMMFGVTRQL